MTPADFARILELAYVDMRPWSEEDIRTTLANPHVALIATGQGGVLAQTLGDDCEILALAVDPDTQRQGVASALLSRLFQHAANHGAERVILEVAASNAPARAFYAAKGFALIGQRKGYYTLKDGRKDDALLLSRPVHPDPGPVAPTSQGHQTKSG